MAYADEIIIDGQRLALTDLKRALLLSDAVPNTVQAITFDDAGNVSTIVHANNGVTVRIDTFTFAGTTITEARALTTGGSLTLVTDLTTLQTTVTYTTA